MTQEQIEQLKSQVAEGRGFWVGVAMGPIVQADDGHPIQRWLPGDSHVTLLHFGKKRNPFDVQLICDSIEEAVLATLYRGEGVPLEITGIGTFWRSGVDAHPMALVNSGALFDLRASIRRCLSARVIKLEDRYGFIPHLSLSPGAPIDELLNCRSLRATGRVVVVCGNARIMIP